MTTSRDSLGLLKKECNKDFPFVEKNFKVINSDTRIAVADIKIVDRIRNGHCDWRELQKHSLQIANYKLQELRIPQIAEDIYHWNLAYDDFLGYMAGIIQNLSPNSSCIREYVEVDHPGDLPYLLWHPDHPFLHGRSRPLIDFYDTTYNNAIS